MARKSRSGQPKDLAYHGEVWTDARGYATVNLPVPTRPLQPPLDYALQPLQADVEASVAAELADGRFTIRTDEPHVKVAWRLSGSPINVSMPNGETPSAGPH